MTNKQIKARLKYLRGEIEAEQISYGEIAELQSLAEHIEDGDVLLLEWAGVPESQQNNRAIRSCIANGKHLTSCDDDGYCNHCGYQEDGDGPVEKTKAE